MGGRFLFRYECIIPLFIQSHPRYSEVEQQQNALSSLLPQTFIISYCLLSLKFHRLLQTKGAASPALIQPTLPSAHDSADTSAPALRAGAASRPTPDPLADGCRGTGHGQTVIDLLSGQEGDGNLFFFFLNYENSVSIKDRPDPKGAQFASPFPSSPCNYKATEAAVAFHLCIPGTHLLLHLLQSSTTFCASAIAPVIPIPKMQNGRTREGSSLSKLMEDPCGIRERLRLKCKPEFNTLLSSFWVKF